VSVGSSSQWLSLPSINSFVAVCIVRFYGCFNIQGGATTEIFGHFGTVIEIILQGSVATRLGRDGIFAND